MAKADIITRETKSVSPAESLRSATERAERAEAELARMKTRETSSATADLPFAPEDVAPSADSQSSIDGAAELRKDSMMAHLMDSLDAGRDIGHYGRLVFAMVARHFMTNEEVLSWLRRDRDFGESEAIMMLRQVENRDYSPPKRERILEWQAEQDFPILPNLEDPDCGNLYRNLKFPDSIYQHIEDYREHKVGAKS